MSNPHAVTAHFEQALSVYTRAPYVNVVNSCTMALRLCFDYLHRSEGPRTLTLPTRTYVSVANEAINAGHSVEWKAFQWVLWYRIEPTVIVDAAHWFESGMYRSGLMMCLSFHAQKPLGLEQGGAILHDNKAAYDWFCRARFDGRTPGVPVAKDSFDMPVRYRHHCYINPSTSALGVQRLYALTQHDTNYPDCSKVNYA